MLMERWAWAKDGDGQVLLLSGEPGDRQIAPDPRPASGAGRRAVHVALRHYCSPYRTNSALHPVVEQLERAAGFAADDGSERLDKLEAVLGQASERIADGRRCSRRSCRS